MVAISSGLDPLFFRSKQQALRRQQERQQEASPPAKVPDLNWTDSFPEIDLSSVWEEAEREARRRSLEEEEEEEEEEYDQL